jgi:Smg protein
MFDVLVYLYENYWRPDACPEPKQLSRKLSAVGFEPEEIHDALHWLDGLAVSAGGSAEVAAFAEIAQAGDAEDADETSTPSPDPAVRPSMRIYTEQEQEVLGETSIGFITFLESAGVMPGPMREMVIDRALAAGSSPIELEELKIIVLMVFWSLGQEPDALVLDELFVASEDRLIH